MLTSLFATENSDILIPLELRIYEAQIFPEKKGEISWKTFHSETTALFELF